MLKKIIEHFRKEQESAVRVKILSLFSEFAIDGKVEGSVLIDEMLLLLKNEVSMKVVSQALYSMYKIGLSQQLPTTHVAKMVFYAQNQLTSYSHNVQRHSLLLLGAYASLTEAEKETMSLVGKYTDSQDSRVRAQAFRSILTLGSRGVPLLPVLFSRASAALNDDYECVRKEALQLVSELGIKHPD